MELFSPAKINLFLKVLSKRADGYHELLTLMQALDFGDRLTIDHATSDRWTCSDSQLGMTNQNLVSKAVGLFRKKTGIMTPFSIHLSKKIPIEAGLGGGSSNAAAVLWGCNRLCGEPAGREELIQWSKELGSDVPFFFSGGTAICRGRGEIVENVKLPSTHFNRVLIVKPPLALSTPRVFDQFFDPFSSSNLTLQDYLEGKMGYLNDLQPAIFRTEPRMEEIYKYLLSLKFDTVFITGTGSAFVCVGSPCHSLDASFKSLSTSFIVRPVSGSLFTHSAVNL